MARTKYNLSAKITLGAFVLLLTLLSAALPARAFDPSYYASESALAKGRWMKISVEREGVYLIPTSTLRSWGFTDPSRVRIHGYGGRRIPTILNAANYPDDLPQIQSVLTDRGVVFYGVGPGEWVQSSVNRYRWDMNVYTQAAYYFVTEAENGDDTDARRSIETAGRAGASNPATTFYDRMHHEVEILSPAEAGALLVGEDFKNTRSRDFQFDMTDPADDCAGWIECSFVSSFSTSGATLSFTANNQPITANSTDRISALGSSTYTYGIETVARHDFSFKPNGSRMTIGIRLSTGGVVRNAWLNYLSFNYVRKLTVPRDGHLQFWTGSTQLKLDNAPSGTTVWDVTNPADIKAMDTASEGNSLLWSSPYTGARTYVAWKADATLPAPKAEGFVSHQNLHGLQSVNMVIITPGTYTAQAERIADFHRNSSDALSVAVVDVNEIYNEFGSGSADVSAIRKFLKMLYDRGKAGEGDPLRYALLFARMTIDNRHISSALTNNPHPTIPGWMPTACRASLSDNEGYSTDDYIAMLDDNSGDDMGLDDLCIAVGRMPVTSVEEARSSVDKILEYAAGNRKSAWKQRFMFLADDEDRGIHVEQTEDLIGYLKDTRNEQHVVRKVYMDAYTKEGSSYPLAKETMFRYLEEGVVWWNFVGHANESGWTGEQQLSYSDINKMYLRHWPFIYAATCEFLRWDSSTISGAEILWLERYGGAIGVISATRPVYISDNGLLSNAVGRAMARRDENGRFLTPGEIYRTAKNNILNSKGEKRSNENRLRYMFMGDPALRLAMPDNIVKIDRIGSEDLLPDAQLTLAALQQTTISGRITAPDGTLIDGFNGVVVLDIHDAEQTITTKGHGENGKEIPFEEYGKRIFSGSTKVVNGEFTINVAMPAEIEQNFRPAMMSMYAYSTENNDEAVGINTDFYVYGFDEDARPDTTPPVIESCVLNHSSFNSGDAVNTSPMLIASVSDDTGLNLSSAGVGHQMTAILDGSHSFTDLADYFTPSADGTPSGVINYPFEDLTEGNHTLMFRVWDTSGNSATSEFEFYVQPNIAPKIYDVYTDANPASDVANFYLSHDQPDAMVTVVITVYNLLGKPVWSRTEKGASDMFLSMPVSWDLTDYSGLRVQRGIYLYRAAISTDNETFETASRRIAVTAPR